MASQDGVQTPAAASAPPTQAHELPAAELAAFLKEKDEIMLEIRNATDSETKADLSLRLGVVTSNILCLHVIAQQGLTPLVNQHSESINTLKQTASNQGQLIVNLQKESSNLRFQNKILTGRLIQNEKRLDTAMEMINDLTARSMRDNIIFYTSGQEYTERRNESYQQSAQLVKKFLHDVLGISEAYDFTITRAHRMGHATGEGMNRPLIAKFPFQSELDWIFSKASSLKGKKHSISAQMPNDYKEKKMQGWSLFKKARDSGKKASFRPNGQLVIEKREVQNYKPLQLPATSDTKLGDLISGQGAPMATNSHKFIARCVSVKNPQEVRNAMDLFCVEEPAETASANCIPYAVRLQKQDGTIREDFNSKADNGAGPQILKLLKAKKMVNVVCMVAHSYTDKNSDGKTKFAFMERAISESITSLQSALAAAESEEAAAMDEDDGSSSDRDSESSDT